MLNLFLITLLALAASSNGLKFLAWSPRVGSSHVNYIGKCADALIDAGHEVVIATQPLDRDVHSFGSKKARIMEIPLPEAGTAYADLVADFKAGFWRLPGLLTMLTEGMRNATLLGEGMKTIWNETLHTPGFVERIRAEKFDAAFAEMMDLTPIILFHLAGIDKFAITVSFGMSMLPYSVTHAPSNPSYVPGLVSWFGDSMTFFERLQNSALDVGMRLFPLTLGSLAQDVVDGLDPNAPGIWELVRRSSLIFINTDPLLDFPKPTTHRVIDIGGITIESAAPKTLDEYWSGVMGRRPQTVLLSFGTYVSAALMPEEYKTTIREALAAFPNVTFIWKYEEPSHNVSAGLENVVETTWMPQLDILRDGRLTAFITHGGQGSILEAAYSGTPQLCIAVQGDQFRNCQIVKRNALGIALFKEDLGEGPKLQEAIRDIIDNPMYRDSAQKKAGMLRSRPFSPKQVFVRNMEFMARYGPLHLLDHYGAELNFFQYFLIDIFAFLGVIVLAVLALIGLCIRSIVRCVKRCRSRSDPASYDPVPSPEPCLDKKCD